MGDRAEIGDLESALDKLVEQLRLVAWRDLDGQRWFAAVEDAGRVRDCFGVALDMGLPQEFTEPVANPIEDLVLRLGLTSGPFDLAYVRTRLPMAASVALGALGRLVADGLLITGEFRPTGRDQEWCSPRILAEIKRKSLAAARAEIEPVPVQCLAEFVTRHQGVGDRLAAGRLALEDVLLQLEGAPLAALALERDILPARVADYRPAMLDALFADGDLVWIGAGSVGPRDGRLRLVFRENLAEVLTVYPSAHAADDLELSELQQLILAALAGDGTGGGSALRFRDLIERSTRPDSPVEFDRQAFIDALWGLAWAGLVTNDSFGPVRAAAVPTRRGASSARSARSRSAGVRSSGGRVGRISRSRRPDSPESAGRWWALDYGAAGSTEAAGAGSGSEGGVGSGAQARSRRGTRTVPAATPGSGSGAPSA